MYNFSIKVGIFFSLEGNLKNEVVFVYDIKISCLFYFVCNKVYENKLIIDKFGSFLNCCLF